MIQNGALHRFASDQKKRVASKKCQDKVQNGGLTVM
jgi:hypothetical protein